MHSQEVGRSSFNKKIFFSILTLLAVFFLIFLVFSFNKKDKTHTPEIENIAEEINEEEILTSPSEPLNIVAQKADSVIILKWDPPLNDGGSPIIGYQIERMELPSSPWQLIVENTESTKTEFVDEGVEEGKEYNYRLSALNKAMEVGKPADVKEQGVFVTPISVSASNPVVAWQASEISIRVSVTSTEGSFFEVRYSWNVNEMNNDCTEGGITTNPGSELLAPEGGSTLYLCGRDEFDNVSTWSGVYNWREEAPARRTQQPAPAPSQSTPKPAPSPQQPTSPTTPSAPVDTTAPVTTLKFTNFTCGNWTKENVRVELSCEDNVGGSGCKESKYCIDTNDSCVPSNTYSNSFEISNPGTNYLRYHSFDNSNNSEVIKSCVVNISKSLPSISFFNESNENNYYNALAFSILTPKVQARASFSGLQSFRYAWSNFQTDPTGITSNTCTGGTGVSFDILTKDFVSINASTNSPSSTSDSHYLHVCAVDRGGNISKSFSRYYLDLTVPTGGSIDYANGFQTSTSIPITVSAGFDSHSGMSGNDSDYILEYSSATLENTTGNCLNFEDFQDSAVEETSISTEYTFTGTENTCYKFRYVVKDKVGNTTTYASENVLKIDQSSPENGGFVINGGELYSTSRTGNILNVSCPSDGWGPIEFAYGNSSSPTNWSECTSLITDYDLGSSDGLKTIYMRFRDGGGNTTGDMTDTTILSTSGPQLNASNANTTWYDSLRTAAVTATSAGSGIAEVRYSWGTNEMNEECTTGGIVTSHGAELESPIGGTVLYLCARDNVGDTKTWSGVYNWDYHYTVTYVSTTGGFVLVSSRYVRNGQTSQAPGYTEDDGYTFQNFTRTVGEGGDLDSNTGEVANVTGDQTIQANFTINTYTVTYISTSGGSVNTSSRVVSHGGTSVAPGHSANNCYSFQNFTRTSGSGGTVNSSTGAVTNVTGNQTIRANFVENCASNCAIGATCGGGKKASTTLIAYSSDESTTYTWQNAINRCNAVTYGGYTNWHLPSKDNLNVLYVNRTAIGGFQSASYWSSTEYNTVNAWYLYFSNGNQGGVNKADTNRVRCVRAF